MKIEFDPDKDVANLVKHGLSLADAGRVYHAPNKVTLRSPRTGEDRALDIALVETMGVVLALVYVERNDVVRAISLRRASRQERRLYEDAKQD
ncbi:MAG: BrnT family toxin [Pseudomonadota bacterium]|nr:BrnT family toxin [Pseudomonadota bacterium]MDP1904919.1 BrnT family toxin [Pseudomonadota bacterium]MDP2352042.1 BrnT family toxin [Pseudomonadota bacterium]